MYLKYIVFLVLWLSACSAIDKTPTTNIVYASSWEYAAQSPQAIELEKNWWSHFNSPQLTQLVEIAHQQNLDVLIASERVKQVELQMQIANASLFPSADLNGASGEKSTKAEGAHRASSQSTSLGFAVHYELDLWGSGMANRHAAASSYKSALFTHEAVRLSTSAAVATAWFNYVSLQERINTAQKNTEIAERIQRIVESLYRNGVVSAADVASQRTNFLNQKNALIPLQLQLSQTRAAIALLEGRAPQAYQLANEKLGDFNIPSVVAAGIPADIITRRPDIASSEAQLHAASANVYAARTALLPSVQLSGNTGKTAAELFTLNPAMQAAGWSLSLAQTIFTGGRVKNQVRITQSRQQELLEQYRKTILIALQEVDDAFNRVNLTQQQEENQQQVVSQAERSLKLNEAQYRAGSIGLQALLDSQRSLFQAQDALVQQRLARLKATVDLYKALGGGWVRTA